RVRGALRAAGIADTDADEAREEARKGAWDAALRLAERRRIGPFASAAPSREERERSIAILLRAGHSLEHARRLALAAPGEIPSPDGR
ncbi:MAG TPA: RecX family transcriptional regulator, partial [Allosphingosinicella sp.]|nr:RecX family transcriptional regulator [Allosphingosinicella sp.]